MADTATILNPLSILVAVADLSSLPAQGAKALSKCRLPAVRQALAENPSTQGAARQSLLQDRTPAVWIAALRYTTDPAHLRADRNSSVETARAVAHNRSTSSSALTELLEHESGKVVAAALQNPSTPAAAVRAAAAKWPMKKLFPKEPTAIMASGVGAVMRAQPAAADVWIHGNETIGLRSMARSPNLSVAAARVLVDRKVGGWWKLALAGNPSVPADLLDLAGPSAELRFRARAFTACTPACAHTSALLRAAVQVGSHTLDMQLAECPNFTLEVFQAVLQRSATLVEGDTLARMVDRCGPPGARLALRHLARTKTNAAKRYSRTLHRVNAGIHPDATGLSDQGLTALVSSHLGESAAAWESFLSLAQQWSGTMADLLVASERLA